MTRRRQRDACGCNFGRECNGLGTLHCEAAPEGGCGGDLCICACGGERECPGCDWCNPETDRGDGVADNASDYE